MEYILKYSSLSHLCDIQKETFLKEFSDFKKCEDGIIIPYNDKNYRCMDIYDQVVDSKIHAISFFSGCGGLDIGVQLAGIKVISSLDFDKDAVKTMSSNQFFAHTAHRCDDIRNISAKDYSEIIKTNNPEQLIIVGGPPCQPFSKAGYWITNEKRKGVNDERNMVSEYLRVIDEIRPDGFLLENVESILHPTNRSVVDFIENEIIRMGYNFKRILANAIEFGIPQKRKRVIFVATKDVINGMPTSLSPEEIKNVNVLDWIARFDTDSLTEKEESTLGKTYDLELKEVPPGHNYIALSARDGYPNPKFIANKRFWNFLLKLHPLQPSWTIAAQPGPWVGPFHWENRRLRVNEVASIQTFPMDYNFVGSRRISQKQIGNAVPSLLGKAFAEYLKNNI